MRVLITGVNGFVGTHLSNLLLKKGFEVYGTDRTNSNHLKKLKIFNIDITEKEKITKLLKISKPDIIFHLAAISSVKFCEENPEATKKINIGGTENILSACVELKINPKIIITSSAYVYGIPLYIPIDEKHKTTPTNEYGKSKLEQEKISLEFHKKYGLNVIISRSFNHIGPNQALGFVCSDFAKQIVEIEKGKKTKISVGDLTPKRDFTDVRDIVNAYLLLAKKGKPGEIYNIGSGKSYSIKEILTKLIKLSKSKIEIKENKSLFRKSDIPIFISDNNKFMNLTNWKQKISLDESLNDILIYWRKNP